jgi:hypothetical protein
MQFDREGGICCPHPQCQMGATRPHIPEDNILRHIIYQPWNCICSLHAYTAHFVWQISFVTSCSHSTACGGCRMSGLQASPTGNGGRYLLDKIMTVPSNETLIVFSVNIACRHVRSGKPSVTKDRVYWSEGASCLKVECEALHPRQTYCCDV